MIAEIIVLMPTIISKMIIVYIYSNSTKQTDTSEQKIPYSKNLVD